MNEQDPLNYKLPDGLGGALPDSLSVPQDEAERQPKPYVKPAKPVVKPKEAETLGFITNLPKSLINVAKSLFVDLPVAVATNAYHYTKNPEQYGKDVSLLIHNPAPTGEFLRKGVTDYYTDGFWANFNEDPARFLQDAATVLDGVGLAGKLGQTGRAATVAAKAAEAGHAGLLTDAAKTAAMVGRPLNLAKEAATYVDPLRIAGKGAKLAFGKGLEAIGYGEHTAELENGAAHIAANEALSAADATKKQLLEGLDEAQKKTLMRHLMLGVPEEIEAEVAKGGPVAERLLKWDDRVTKTEEPFWLSTKSLDNEQMIKAKAKAVNIWSSREMEIPIPTDVAEDMIRSGHLKPTYIQLFKLHNDSLDLFSALNNESGAAGKLARLEKRLGGGQYLTDPDEIMARQIQSFHQVKAKMGLLNFTKELMNSKGKLLIAHTDEDVDKAKMLGYRELHDAFYKKYWESYSKATAQQLQTMMEVARKKLSQSDALAALKDAFANAENVGAEITPRDSGRIFVPAHVAAWLNRELAPVSAGWQMYDSWMSRFKSAATVFNPRYWAPVVFGNALIATLYGLSPDMLRLALKYRGDLPPVLKKLVQHDIFLKDLGIYDRKALSFGQAASTLDRIYKQGMFASEVLKDSHARATFSLSTFFPAQAEVEKALQHFAAAPTKYYDTRLKIAQLRTQAAAALAEEDLAYRSLKRREARLTGELERLMREKEISMKELSSSIDARKDRLSQAFSLITEDKPKYRYFADRFLEQLKELRSGVKLRPELVDNAGVIRAMDAAIIAVESGHPEWLRHAVKQLRKSYNGSSPLIAKRQRLSVFVDMVGKAEERVHTATTDKLSSLAQAGQLMKLVPSLAQDLAVADRAIAVGNMFYGSTNNLLPFERTVIKRIIPFYTFTKAMTALAFKFPFIYPKRSFMMLHLARAWNDIMQDENAFMPSWSKNYIPVAGMEDGSVVMIRAGSLGPMSNVRFNSLGEQGIPGVWDVAQQNPVIRLLFEMKGGIPEWSAKPLSPGDHSVRLDNGEVIKWTGTGFQKIIAQPNPIKSLLYLFPQAQLIDSVLHPYAQTDRGWLFNPEPLVDPAGKKLYPKALHDIVTSMIVPTTTVHTDELVRREQVSLALLVREYQREIRTASPDRRGTLLESLKEYISSRKRAIEK